MKLVQLWSKVHELTQRIRERLDEIDKNIFYRHHPEQRVVVLFIPAETEQGKPVVLERERLFSILRVMRDYMVPDIAEVSIKKKSTNERKPTVKDIHCDLNICYMKYRVVWLKY